MGHLMGIDVAAIAEVAQDQLVEIAERIAADARRGYRQHELKTDDPRVGVVVEAGNSGVRVVTHNSLAHLDEWGGDRVYSTPSGAMRSAAARAGNFTEESK